MSPPASLRASALHSFLGSSRSRFLAGPSEQWPTAIASIGNIAGDLDTIVSAVCLAFCQSWLEQPPLAQVAMVPFAREDFRLRQDADLLFRHCGFEFDATGAVADLVYLDEAKTPSGAMPRP